jgi:hypothetical protein
VDRLRDFQDWYRNTALPGHRAVKQSPDMARALRTPMQSPAAWIAALLCFWWLEAPARDALGWLLTEPTPDWRLVRRLLGVATVIGHSRNHGPGSRFRRGLGVAAPSKTSKGPDWQLRTLRGRPRNTRTRWGWLATACGSCREDLGPTE